MKYHNFYEVLRLVSESLPRVPIFLHPPLLMTFSFEVESIVLDAEYRL